MVGHEPTQRRCDGKEKIFPLYYSEKNLFIKLFA